MKYFRSAQVPFQLKVGGTSELFMDGGRILPDFGVVLTYKAIIIFLTVDVRKVSKV